MNPSLNILNLAVVNIILTCILLGWPAGFWVQFPAPAEARVLGRASMLPLAGQ